MLHVYKERKGEGESIEIVQKESLEKFQSFWKYTHSPEASWLWIQALQHHNSQQLFCRGRNKSPSGSFEALTKRHLTLLHNFVDFL